MNKIITISREYGAGGHSIGQQVAQALDIPFYDRDIIKETVKASGFDQDMVEGEDEEFSRGSTIWNNIASLSSSYFSNTHDAIHDLQRAIIIHFAKKEPCVILGRCADVILRQAGMDCFNVFITASPLNRAIRASELTGVKDPNEIQRILAKRDASRHHYYTHYSGQRWGECGNYHLSLDSGVLGYDLCVKLIVDTVKGMG